MLVTERVSKSFGSVLACVDVSLQLDEGRLLAVHGHNGSGKTTLINLLSGSIRADKGRISWHNKELNRLPLHSRTRLGISRSFQWPQLFGEWTVNDHCRLASQHNRLARDSQFLLELLEVPVQEAVPVAKLPFRVQKLLDVALAMCVGPALLLLDEPCAGIERHDVQQVLRAVTYLIEHHNTAVVLVDHDIRFLHECVAATSGSIASMTDGRLTL